MIRVLSNLQRVEQAAAGKLNGLERKPLAKPFDTNASEAQSRSASDSPAQPALHGALSWQTTANAGLSQDRAISTQEAVTQLQGVEVRPGNLQSAVQASPPRALHPSQCMGLM